MKIFYYFLVAATEKKVAWSFNFQLPQYKCGMIVADTELLCDPGRFCSAGQRPLSSWCPVHAANWHRHLFHLQYISNVMTISRAISLRHRHNISMSTGYLGNIILAVLQGSFLGLILCRFFFVTLFCFKRKY